MVFVAGARDDEIETVASSGTPRSNALKVSSPIWTGSEEIARTKLPDLNTTSVESAMRTIEGTARNMGLEVVD